MTQLKDNIQNLLSTKNIHMIPRWKFLLYSSLGVIGLFFTVLLLVFVVSLALFLLSKYGFLYMPLFGFGAALHTLTAIPFILVLFGLILLIVIELLAKNYSFAFKKPLVVTIGVSILFALVVGYLVSLTPFHKSIRDYARNNNLSPFVRAYDRPVPFEKEGEYFYRGTVIATTTESFTLQMFDDASITVYLDGTSTKMILGIHTGDDVLLFARKENDGRPDERLILVRMRAAPPEPFEILHGRGGVKKEMNSIAPKDAMYRESSGTIERMPGEMRMNRP